MWLGMKNSSSNMHSEHTKLDENLTIENCVYSRAFFFFLFKKFSNN